MDTGRLLSELVEAVADGRAPDFEAARAWPLDDGDRARLDSLRAVFDIGQCLATLTTSVSDVGSSSPVEPRAALRELWLPAPSRWGPLEVRELVGHGRFGDVYRAWDPATHRHVALKLLRDGRPASDSVVVQEARLMARVRHANVVTIFGAAHHEGRTGLWMEFIEGRTLEAELRDRGPFEPDEIARTGVELCRALAAVHAAGLVHRDVKASNVMRAADGRLVLGDFGTGLEVEQDAAGVGLAGTPVYLAPEALRGEPATVRSDLYSLGVLLFHLATSSFPVTGRTIGEIRRAHATGRRQSLADLRADVPAALAGAVERALRAAPGDRYERAAEMESALRAASADRIARVHPRQVAAPSTWLRRPLRLAVLGGVVLAIAAAAISWSRGERLGLASFGLTSTSPQSSGTARALRRIQEPAIMWFRGQPSPDGRSFTEVIDNDLGLLDQELGTFRRLTDRASEKGEPLESSAFSPDGARVGYAWRNADGSRELRIRSTAGGPPQIVWRSADLTAHPIDWSADGTRMLCVFEGAHGLRTLGTIRLVGAVTETIAALDAGHSSARFSPDGRHVVFDRLQEPEQVERDVFIVSTDPPHDPVSLVAAPGDDFGPLWTTDGMVIFVSDRTAEPSIWGLAVKDGRATDAARMLHRNVGRIRPHGLSRDGALFYSLQVGLVDVYRASLDLSREPAVGEVRPFVEGLVGSKMNADWSPDGTRVVYISTPHAGTASAPGRRLTVLDLGTGRARDLPRSLSYYAFSLWGQDGRTLLVKGTDLESRRGLYLVDSVTGATRSIARVDSRTPQEIGVAIWGPDPRTVLFSRDKLGVMTLDLEIGVERVLFDYASEGIERLTNLPALRLSRDGASMAYSAARRTAAGKMETVLRVKGPGQAGRDLVVGNLNVEDWTPDGQVLFTSYEEGGAKALWSVASWGGPPRELGLRLSGLRTVRVHPDGRSIAITSGFPGSELWKLENFLPSRSGGGGP